MTTSWMGGWSADATWLGWAGSRIVSIGHLRPGLTALLVALSVLAVLEAGYIFYLRRQADAGSQGHLAGRVDKLAVALTLLTDTTESGLSALAMEVQRMQRAQPATASPRARSRSAMAKRVSAATARGESVTAMAAAEAVSEDEIQLHSALSGGAALPGGA
jgi:hypothetical protein